MDHCFDIDTNLLLQVALPTYLVLDHLIAAFISYLLALIMLLASLYSLVFVLQVSSQLSDRLELLRLVVLVPQTDAAAMAQVAPVEFLLDC